MAYALNTNEGSSRVTLSSTSTYIGYIHTPTFQLSTPIKVPEKALGLVSVESVFFQHPTYFCKEYLDGVMTLDGSATRISQETFAKDFLKGDLHVSELNDTQKLITVDRLLLQILKFIRTVTGDTNLLIKFLFDDDDPTKFVYNGVHLEDDTLADTFVPEDVFDSNRSTISDYEVYSEHIHVLQHLLHRRNGAFTIVMSSVSNITLTGYFCCILGLDPTVTHTLDASTPLKCRLPITGHNYVSLESSIIYPQLSSLTSEKMSSSQLLAIIPTPRSPGDIEYYTNPSVGGKCDISNNTIDSLSFRFMDEYGVSVLSLRNFVITLVVDAMWPTATPLDDRFSLNQVRKLTMQNVRAQLRTHM